MSRTFSAAPQALGYLYQARYALYLAVTRQPELQISIEGIDDVAFEENGTAVELLQLKHHVSPEALTDGSTDLWKTLRIWSSAVSSGEIRLNETILSIVTTAIASDGSGVAALRPGVERQPATALSNIRHFALTSQNTALRSAFDAFQALSEAEQEQLINAIYVIDGSPQIGDVTEQILNRIRLSAPPEHLSSMYERLEGWWFSKVVDILASNEEAFKSVSCHEVHSKIHQIRDSFQPDALPIDEINIDDVDAANDGRHFVLQLTTIGINIGRIEKAIIDHDKAYAQRSRWVRERLLLDEECEKYERRLIDEWEREKLALEDDYYSQITENEIDLVKLGQQIYRWVDRDAEIRIRPNVTEEYIMRGSYHMLADRVPPLVWWHPKFIETNELQNLMIQPEKI